MHSIVDQVAELEAERNELRDQLETERALHDYTKLLLTGARSMVAGTRRQRDEAREQLETVRRQLDYTERCRERTVTDLCAERRKVAELRSQLAVWELRDRLTAGA